MGNIILATDSYKFSHWKQYPPKTEAMQSYIEARGAGRTVFFGLQIFIKDYLLKPFTQENIDEADEFCKLHGEPFNREGWQYILDTYNGYIPVKIKAVPEGTVVDMGNCLVTVECHDPKCFWVASFIETIILRGVWYPTTVATHSYECKQIIKKWLDKTSDNPDQIMFKLHDFGGRGVSSGESAKIGGAAVLVNSMGSDTVEGILCVNKYYGVTGGMAGFSIPAAEHSTITSWGKENEKAAYENMIEQYGGEGKLYACVSDSYDIMNACDIWGSLKDKIIAKGGTLVVRPDSGDPAPTVCAVVERLEKWFGSTINSKGYKVLPDCIRVIQGDGITKGSIDEILSLLTWKGYATDNIAFGMGGGLLQHVNRDTYGFAMKCCAIKVDGEWRDVFKEAPGKNSKKGRLTLIETPSGKQTVRVEQVPHGAKEILQTVYKIDVITGLPKTNFITFDEVRKNSNK